MLLYGLLHVDKDTILVIIMLICITIYIYVYIFGYNDIKDCIYIVRNAITIMYSDYNYCDIL